MANPVKRSHTELGRFAGNTVFRAAVGLGVAVHAAVVVVAGNGVTTPWSGGSDMREYITLARNLLAGSGFTYAHQPTALRAPVYPLLLAALMWLAPQHWPLFLHIVQFVAILATAWFCGRLADRCFGETAGRFAIAVALFFPTLVYEGGEVMTESTTALLVILFFVFLIESVRVGTTRSLVSTGFFAGVAALERFNAAALALVAIAAVFLWTPQAEGCPRAPTRLPLTSPHRWRRSLLVGGTCLIVVAPWLLHTLIVFHGQAIYSTHEGYAAVEGIMMPLGRTQPGQTGAIKRALGWTHEDIETNSAERLRFAPEPVLNHQAMLLAFRLWRSTGWGILPILGKKLGAFWLSTDQIVDTHSFSVRNRLLRGAGVGVYWIILVLAVIGWLGLRRSHHETAQVLLLYALAVTAMHLPLTMNTRLRSPLFDPLLAALGGGGMLSLWAWVNALWFRKQTIGLKT